ncbi:MAG: Na+/H+ antiporter NhaC family protein [Oscillospiraceae bacterium]|jgi:predicted histidine transporter YuiF (NhaC family)
MAIITNPVFASVVIMLVLCVLHVNVYLAIIIAAVICGLMGGAPLTEIISLFASGISSHGENAIIFIILAAIASAIVASGMSDAMAPRVSKILGQRPWLLLVGLIIIAALCETVITFGATFVFIIIPPLLTVFNRYSVDRRKVATAIMCGLQIGYVCIPIGYGAVFQDMVAGVMSDCGIEITYLEVAVTTWPIFLAMVVAAVVVAVVYRKPRTYTPVPGITAPAETDGAQTDELPPWEFKHTMGIVAAFATPVVQLITGSIVLGGLTALALILIFRVASIKSLDEHIYKGMKDVAAVVFVMAAGTGYANVSNAYGDVNGLVNSIVNMLGSSKLVGAFAMLVLGLIVTLGIGTSWGTVPIVGIIMVPMGLQMGFSVPAISMLICAAAVLGDAGSPASDQALLPTATLNLDGQHDHIWDTCVPSFICCNVPIIVLGTICACIM